MSDVVADGRLEGTPLAVLPGPMVPFARPLASKSLRKMIYSIVASAASAGALRRGVKEVVKAIRMGDGSLVVIAGDVRYKYERFMVPDTGALAPYILYALQPRGCDFAPPRRLRGCLDSVCVC